MLLDAHSACQDGDQGGFALVRIVGEIRELGPYLNTAHDS